MTHHSREMLQEDLERETKRWAAKPVETLQTQLQHPISYCREVETHAYQVEVQILEDASDHMLVMVLVDDTSFWRGIQPVSTGFVVPKGTAGAEAPQLLFV